MIRRRKSPTLDLYYLDAGDGAAALPIAGCDLRLREEHMPLPRPAFRLDGHGLLAVAASRTRDGDGHIWERRLYLRVL